MANIIEHIGIIFLTVLAISALSTALLVWLCSRAPEMDDYGNVIPLKEKERT